MKDEKKVDTYRQIIYMTLTQHFAITQQYLQRPAVLVDPKGIKRTKGDLMKSRRRERKLIHG